MSSRIITCNNTQLPTHRIQFEKSNGKFLNTHIIVLILHPVTTISSYTSRTDLRLNDSRNLKNWRLAEILGQGILWGAFKKACFTISKVFGMKWQLCRKVKWVCMYFESLIKCLFSFYNDRPLLLKCASYFTFWTMKHKQNKF